MAPQDDDSPPARPAGDRPGDEDPLETNRAHWEELAEVHPETDGYDVAGFLAGDSTLRESELEALGDVSGDSVVHLQCHIGLDTLSLARLGADVVGLDFSAEAVRAARDIRDEAGLDAAFVEADVLDAGDVLDPEFDVVFASFGVLSWVRDLEAWMDVAADLARTGGRLVLVDHHPVLAGFDWYLEPEGSYFREGPARWDEEGTYADPDADVEHSTYYTWQHGLGEVVTAASGAGFRVDALREYPYLYHEKFGPLEVDEDGRYRLPGDPFPMLFGLVATRMD